MAKWKLVVGVLLVFSAGMLVGSISTGYGLRFFFDRFKHDSQYRINFIMGRYTRRLDLNDTQKTKIKTILTRADKEINQYWLEVLYEASGKIDRVKKEIRKELNPDQAIRFDKFSNNINAEKEEKTFFFYPPGPAKRTP